MEDTQKAAFPTSFAQTVDRVPLHYRAFQKFQSIAQQWQQQMQEMEFPILICGGDYPAVKLAAIWLRIKAALNETPNPFAQAIRTEAASSIPREMDADWFEPCIPKLEARRG